ncbi:hypothetical protein [Streptomyces sp. NPDC005485]|uniref:hypothetical protein n=1 Tax=Streptomyces sp. NPDC005485 TaxID=3155591 RepID=UPI0033BCEFBA
MRTTVPGRAPRVLAGVRALAAGALAVTLGAGCSSGTTTGHATPAPDDTSAVSACTKLIAYWAEQTLTGGKWAGLDWEQKGLSNQQYEIMDAIIKNARAEQKRHGPASAKTLIDRQAKQRCTEEKGATRSSENWRPPT